MIKPVTGPARFNKGNSEGLAPKKEKIGLKAVCCSPKLNWIPKKPIFILKICQKLRRGLMRMTIFFRLMFLEMYQSLHCSW